MDKYIFLEIDPKVKGYPKLNVLLKLASWTALTMLVGALINKVIAVSAGTIGIGQFSIYRQVQQTIVSIYTLNGDAGLVQGISSRADDKKTQYIVSVGKFLFINILIISIAFLFFLGTRFDFIENKYPIFNGIIKYAILTSSI